MRRYSKAQRAKLLYCNMSQSQQSTGVWKSASVWWPKTWHSSVVVHTCWIFISEVTLECVGSDPLASQDIISDWPRLFTQHRVFSLFLGLINTFHWFHVLPLAPGNYEYHQTRTRHSVKGGGADGFERYIYSSSSSYFMLSSDVHIILSCKPTTTTKLSLPFKRKPLHLFHRLHFYSLPFYEIICCYFCLLISIILYSLLMFT